jgi:(p)ppGpp synthase/HD superfamily hydrolase
MKLLARAISIASQAFEHRLDKGGKPYILHCLYVMGGADPNDEDEMIAGVLHDLVEDTDWTEEKLKEAGFSDRSIRIIKLLTHHSSDTYDHYIKKISFDPSATKLKQKDLEHNSNITRLKGLRKVDFDRIEQYHKAFVYLSA